MKKAFIALMSTFLGLFGYTVVDQALEARVANLESYVSSQAIVIDSQQDEIESLHRLGKYDDSSTTISHTSASYWKGKVFQPNNLQTKYMFRVYSDGTVYLVRTGVNHASATRWTNTKSKADRYTITNKATGTDALVTEAPIFDDRGQDRFDNGTTTKITCKECFLYVDSVELKVIDVETKREKRYYYDENYSENAIDFDVNKYTLSFRVAGHADKELAGKTLYIDVHNPNNGTLLFQSYYQPDFGRYNPSISCKIDENGNYDVSDSLIYDGSNYVESLEYPCNYYLECLEKEGYWLNYSFNPNMQ